MNHHPSQTFILPLRSLSERVVVGLGKALRAGALLALWRHNRARSRDARAVDAVADMNEHMLKDIGAHERLISHAAAQSDADHRRRISVQLSTPLLVVALTVTAVLGTAGEATASPPTSKASAKARLVGVFTGEYVDGLPVYHLPAVRVVASRKVERAKFEREEQFARGQQAREKAVAKDPA